MRLSVVVPVLDEAPAIERALSPLQSLRAEGAEIIVVDGGSRDGTAQRATPFADRVLTAPRGRAVQMNVGAHVASGNALLFLHADCRLPRDAMRSIERALERGTSWGRFDVSLEGRSALLPVIAAFMNVRSRWTSIATGDQALFVARRTFEAIGGYEPLPLMEDVALSRTLRGCAGRPACLRERVVASGRRWDRDGALATIGAMWALRYAFRRGADPTLLAARYYGHAPEAPATLIVFAKTPLPGRVKTRLAATLGADAAAGVYRDLLQRTLDVACAARRAGVAGEVELWAAPEDPPGVLHDWCAARRIELRTQQGADLGARMHGALVRSLSRGRPALLIGSDVPGYDVAYLAAAASALQRADAVIGPAEDGGYVLVGLARDVDAFSRVPWSTDAVLAATRDRLAEAGATWHELPALWDVDTYDDFLRWQRETAAEV